MTSNQFPTTQTSLKYGVMAMVLLWGASAFAQEASDARYTAYYPLKNQPAASLVQQLGGLLDQLLPDEQVRVHRASDSQVCVEGTPRAHQTVATLLKRLDVPSEPVKTAPPEALPPIHPTPDSRPDVPAKPVARIYPADAGGPEDMAQRWHALSQNRPDVRIAAIPENNQVVVFAPPDFHELLTRQTQPPTASAVPESAGMPPSQPVSPEMPSAELQQVESFIPLARIGVDQAEKALQSIIGSRLRFQPDQSTSGRVYVFEVSREGQLRIAMDARRSGIMVQGPRRLVEQFTHLVRRLDAPTVTDRTRRIIPLRRADLRKVREAVNAYRSGANPPDDEGSSSGPPNGGEADGRRGPRGINLVNYELVSQIMQPGGGPPPVMPPRMVPGAYPGWGFGPEDLDDPTLRELGTDLEVEILPDLDVVILQGRPRDVEAMTKIIEELERLSAETVPQIEVLLLQHTSGEAMAEIIEQVREDLIGGRQGRIAVLPLVKPNALLLIGWGESVKAIKGLVDELDKPVSPESQFCVFPLKYASATQVRSDLLEFFDKDEGLAPRIEVVAEVRTNSLLVRASSRDMAEVARFIEKVDVDESGAVSRVKIFKLKNSLADEIGGTLQSAIDAARGGGRSEKASILELLAIDKQEATLIRSGLLADVNIVPDVRTNSLIVSAPAQSLPLIEALIERLDAPSVVAQIKVFQIVNADANNMVRTLQSLLPTQQAGLSSRPTLPVAEGESSLAPVRFAVDIRTNSIIATGSQGDLAIIEALLLRLDEKDVIERETTVYRLRNSPAVDVANAISNFLRSERQVERGVPGQESPFRQIEREVIVVPELINNALIISATPRYFDEIMQLIKKLDEHPPQVAIQVLIAEVRLDNLDEFGVELGLQDSLLFDRGLLSEIQTITNTDVVSTPSGIITVTEQEVVSADTIPGYNFVGLPLGNNSSRNALANKSNVAGQGTTSFAVGRINNELGFGGLTLSASSDSVSVLVRALQECRRLEVLSRPQIRTMDNQSAFIQIGQRVPRITGVTLNQNGMTQNIELEDVGLILGVTPRISPEGNVVMELDAEKSELAPQADGIPVAVQGGQVIYSPSVNVTTAQTTVSARSGETIVLGGLIINGTSEVHRRVPWLWKIPILGHLFRYDSVETRRVELLIIMTPWIIRTPEDDERFKQREAARMHWCLAAVNQIHGDTGLFDITGPVAGAACFDQVPGVVYPDAQGVILPPEVGKEGEMSPGGTMALPEAIPTPRPLMQGMPGNGVPPAGAQPPLIQPPMQQPVRQPVQQPPPDSLPSPSPRDDWMRLHPEPAYQENGPMTRTVAPTDGAVRSYTVPSVSQNR